MNNNEKRNRRPPANEDNYKWLGMAQTKEVSQRSSLKLFTFFHRVGINGVRRRKRDADDCGLGEQRVGREMLEAEQRLGEKKRNATNALGTDFYDCFARHFHIPLNDLYCFAFVHRFSALASAPSNNKPEIRKEQ